MHYILHRNLGFNLIELLIVLALLSMISAFSVPLYTKWLAYTKRLEAWMTLNKLTMIVERYHIEHATYQGVTLPLINNAHYRFSITSDATQYTLTALPIGIQAIRDKKCGALTINEKAETSTAFNREECLTY